MQALLKSPRHRLPVLWSLYRPLLRLSPSSEIRWHVRGRLRVGKKVKDLAAIKSLLKEGYDMLEEFDKLKVGDEYLAEKYRKMTIQISALKEIKKLRKTPTPQIPIRYGTYTKNILKATVLNPPLPMIKPQPQHISGMIRSRRIAQDKRLRSFRNAGEMIRHAELETDFELRARFSGGNPPNLNTSRMTSNLDSTGLGHHLREFRTDIFKTMSRDRERAEMPIPEELYRKAAEAAQRRGPARPGTTKRQRRERRLIYHERLISQQDPKVLNMVNDLRGWIGQMSTKDAPE